MKMKSVMLLAVAIGCGLVAMLGVQQVLKRDKAEPDKMGKVLKAIAMIAPGEPLDEKNTAFEEMRADAIPQGAVTRVEEIEDRAIMFATVPGEVIMLQKLGDKGNYRPTAEIPKGMRVHSLSVDTTKAHSNLIRPGDHVDLVVTYQVLQPRRMQRTKTFLQNIEVFATDAVRLTGTAAEGGDSSMKNISLLVTPEQYARCVLAQKMGEVTMAMRSNGDNDVVEVAPIDETLFEDAAVGFGMDAENPLIARDREFAEGGEGSAPQPATGDVRQFLQQNQSTVTPAPAKPKWSMTIYEGEVARVVELDVPEEKEAEEQIGAEAFSLPQILHVAPAGAKAGPEASSSIKGWMKSLMAGA